MQISIKDSTTVGEIKAAFERYFPSLDLEFYTGPQSSNPKIDGLRLHDDTPVGNYRPFRANGFLNIDESTSVMGLEEMFRNFFGLYVKVYRKSDRLALSLPEYSEKPLTLHENESSRLLSSNTMNEGSGA